MTPDALVGTWRLRRFAVTFADGRPPVEPYDEGLLVYAADGWMTAMLSRSDRSPLGVARLEARATASVEARAAAFDSFLAYGGRWRLDGDHVVHEVTHALTPELVGRENRRRVRRSGEDVELSYAVTPSSGVTRTMTLVWARP